MKLKILLTIGIVLIFAGLVAILGGGGIGCQKPQEVVTYTQKDINNMAVSCLKEKGITSIQAIETRFWYKEGSAEFWWVYCKCCFFDYDRIAEVRVYVDPVDKTWGATMGALYTPEEWASKKQIEKELGL